MSLQPKKTPTPEEVSEEQEGTFSSDDTEIIPATQVAPKKKRGKGSRKGKK